MPPKAVLPDDIAPLSDIQAVRLSREGWVKDINALARILAEDGTVTAIEGAALDIPDIDRIMKNEPALTEQELDVALKSLDGWVVRQEILMKEWPHVRSELRRTITFLSFAVAIEFMQKAAKKFEKKKHHPRRGNEWKHVTIGLSTWDAGNKITRLDVEAARMVDALVRDFKARYIQSSKSSKPVC